MRVPEPSQSTAGTRRAPGSWGVGGCPVPASPEGARRRHRATLRGRGRGPKPLPLSWSKDAGPGGTFGAAVTESKPHCPGGHACLLTGTRTQSRGVQKQRTHKDLPEAASKASVSDGARAPSEALRPPRGPNLGSSFTGWPSPDDSAPVISVVTGPACRWCLLGLAQLPVTQAWGRRLRNNSGLREGPWPFGCGGEAGS